MLKIYQIFALLSVLSASLCIETNIETETTYTASNILIPFTTKIGGKYYFIESKAKLNWHAAAEHCRQIGGHLWDIQDAKEMDAVLKHLKLADYWLAGSDLAKEGNYVSIASGFKMPYLRWHQHQPDNALGRENCIHILYRNNLMRMNDHHCDQLKYFVCEANVPKTVSVTICDMFLFNTDYGSLRKTKTSYEFNVNITKFGYLKKVCMTCNGMPVTSGNFEYEKMHKCKRRLQFRIKDPYENIVDR